MIKQSIYILLFLLSCLTASCSRMDGFFGGGGEMTKTCNMVLHCSNPSYDQGTTRATGNTWDVGDEIYIYFADELYGVGSYSGSWSFSYEGSFASTQQGTCTAYYVKNASRTGTKVTLDENTPVFLARDVLYFFESNVLTLEANFYPYSVRLRLLGEPNQELYIKEDVGLSYYSSLDFSTNTFDREERALSLVTKEDGYTDFVYFSPAESDVNISIVIGNTTFSRKIDSSIFHAGETGFFSIPSSSSHQGWSMSVFDPNWISLQSVVDNGQEETTSFQVVRYRYCENGLNNSATNTTGNIVAYFSDGCDIWLGNGELHDHSSLIYQGKEAVPSADGWVYYVFSSPVYYIDKQENANLEDIEFYIGDFDTTKILSLNLVGSNSVVLGVGNQYNINVKVIPANAKNQVLEWESSDSSIATVEDGQVVAQSVGIAIITAKTTDGTSLSASCAIEVKEAIKEYVDLGLPSGRLWATCDIGAYAIGSMGSGFRWGEITSNMSEPYKFGDYSPTKYNQEDHLIFLEPEDDAAYSLWGDGWRIPTPDDFQELIDNCNFEYTSDYYGCRKVVGPNGNYIYINNQIYWTNQLSEERPYYATYFYINGSNNQRTDRSSAFLIRPVHSSFEDIYRVNKLILPEQKKLYEGSCTTLSLSVQPLYGRYKSLIWNSSDSSVASVTNGVVTANASGSAIITVYLEESPNIVATCEVVVLKKSKENFPVLDFMFNYNFKQYDQMTQTVPNHPDALWAEDLVLSGTPNVHDGFISVNNSDAYAQYVFDSTSDNPFNRNNNNGNELTVIYKIGQTEGEGMDMISNRGYPGGHNWMVRPGKSPYFHKNSSYIVPIKDDLIERPSILYILNDSGNMATHGVFGSDIVEIDVNNNEFGGDSGRICFFCSNQYYTDSDGISEYFTGEVYWMFVANRVLSPEEIQAVVEYNESL